MPLEAPLLVQRNAFNSLVQFKALKTVYPPANVSAGMNFTLDAGAKLPGAQTEYTITGNGLNCPVFTGFQRTSHSRLFDYRNGAANRIVFTWDGTTAWVTVTPISRTQVDVFDRPDVLVGGLGWDLVNLGGLVSANINQSRLKLTSNGNFSSTSDQGFFLYRNINLDNANTWSVEIGELPTAIVSIIQLRESIASNSRFYGVSARQSGSMRRDLRNSTGGTISNSNLSEETLFRSWLSLRFEQETFSILIDGLVANTFETSTWLPSVICLTGDSGHASNPDPKTIEIFRYVESLNKVPE